MKLVFFGTPEFAVPTLESLALAPACELIAAVTQPDRRAGRGRKLIRPALALRADALELPVLQPQKARDPEFQQALRALAPDLVVVVAYGEIFPQELLSIPPLGFYNLHASLLPQHRGPSPINAAIQAGDTVGGLTFFQIVKRMDAGPILDCAQTAIGPRETAGELHDRLAQLGAKLVCDSVAALASGPVSLTEQQESEASYCKLMHKRDGRIDWTADCQTVDRQIRAMLPWPGPRSTLQRGEASAELTIARAIPDPAGAVAGASPGDILGSEGGTLVVATGAGTLAIDRLIPAGKREMAVDEYLRGNPVASGSCFA
ncbi:methionyl-tRNA formyltransferase [bacterium AH-315-M10]|nr:methionyl-tRNA formyltransferase [bacterium AH-315-M10]